MAESSHHSFRWPRGAARVRARLELSSADGLAEPQAPGAPAVIPPTDVDALPRSDGGLEVQIGLEDDTIEVGFLHAGAAASRSVAKLMVHRHFEGVPAMLATGGPRQRDGWMIAPRLLITNHHVINGRGPFEPPASEQDFQLQGTATEVIFDFFAAESAQVIAKSVGCVASDKTLDFALLRLPDDAPNRPPLPLRTSAILKPMDARSGSG